MKGSDTFKDLIENAVDSNEKIAGMADDIKQANDELAQQAQEIAKNARGYREGSDQRYKPVEHGRRCVFFSERA